MGNEDKSKMSENNNGRTALQSGQIEEAFEHYDTSGDERVDHLIQGALCALQLDKIDQARGMIQLALDKHSQVPMVHLVKCRIEMKAENRQVALESAREAVALCPDDVSLAAYIDLVEERLAGNDEARFNKTTVDEALKKLKMDSRTARYLNDPAFASTVEKVVKGEMDVVTIKRDERIHQVLDVLSGFVANVAPDDDKYQIVISDDEEVDEPPLPMPSPTTIELLKAADALKLKGNEQYCDKNLKAALEFYQQAAEVDPSSPVILSNMAAVYTDMKRIDAAREYCQLSIEKSHQYGIKCSTLAKVYNRLGTLDHTEGHYRLAISWFRRAIKLDGEYSKAKSNLQRTEARLTAELRKAMWDLDKANGMILKAEKLLTVDKNEPEAFETYATVTKYIPTNETKLHAKVHVGRAKCHLFNAKYHSALMEADQASELDKDCHNAFTIKGIAHEGLNAYELATAAYTTTLRIDPGDTTAKQGLERCLKASFVVRNGTKAQEKRIYKNEIIKDAINDTQSIIDSLNETKLTDYCTDGFKAAQLQKLIDVGLIAFDTPHARVYPNKTADCN